MSSRRTARDAGAIQDPDSDEAAGTTRVIDAAGGRGATRARGKTKAQGKASAPAKERVRPAKAPRSSTARKKASQEGQGARAAVRLPRKALILSGSAIVAVLAVAGYLLLSQQAAAHVVTVPAQIGGYAKQPTLASATALQLKKTIVSRAAGEVKNVVAATYEETTGPGTSAGPQVVVFIGGNLSGGSASSFISGFMTQLHGSFLTNAGSLGGQAACAPGSNGGLAECAWADNDTFGVVVSATLNATGLAREMQQMRPMIEHVAK